MARRVVVLSLVLALAAAACSSSDSSSGGSSSTTTAVESTTTDDAAPVVETSFSTVQGQPYAEPPILKSSDGVLETTLDVAPTTFEVAGQQVEGMSYAGEFLGPTLLVEPGDTIKIDLQNRLDEETNFHTHGLHTSPIGISDNVLRVMDAGSDSPIEIQVPEDIAPGTYWYHAHLHGLTEAQVFSGLAGALVVDGLTPRLPVELQDVPEKLIALKDLQVDDKNRIITDNIDSNAPTTRTVNGLVNPVIDAQPGGAQLFRLANMSADIWYLLEMEGSQFTVLAEDANPVSVVTESDQLLLPPGKRFDVLVRWDEAGTYKLKTLEYQTGPDGDDYPERVLATVKVAGDQVPPTPWPTSMGEAPGLEDAEIAQHREVVFSEDPKTNEFFINDQMFSMDTVMYTPQLGTVEEWTIKNTAREEHPFHIHVNDFQVMSINGEAQPGYGLQDVVKLPAGGEVVVRMRFADFLGKYVFHCHILAHEDAGMMAIIDVTEDGKPAPEGADDTSTSMAGM